MTDPADTQKIESVSAAAIAYAKEQDDYELVMQAWRVYIEARRRTTELVKYDIDHNINVTTAEYGFTKMQWSRRMKELSIPKPVVDAYFDKLTSNGWQPSIAGLLREASGNEIDREARALEELRRSVRFLVHEYGYETKQIDNIIAEALK